MTLLDFSTSTFTQTVTLVDSKLLLVEKLNDITKQKNISLKTVQRMKNYKNATGHSFKPLMFKFEEVWNGSHPPIGIIF